MTVRSALYVPGDQADKLERALTRGADAVIVDLEDAVPPEAKEAARALVADWLTRLDLHRPAQVWVRVNSGADAPADLLALAGQPVVTGFVLAKTEGPEHVTSAAALLDELGSAARLSPLLESAAAVLRAPDTARAPRVAYLQVGEVDLCADAGITPGEDESELLLVRSSVVLASAAAGIAPPLAPVSTDFRDLTRLRRSSQALRRLGYVGRACIHPAQVAVANEVFTPSSQEVDRARDVVRRFKEAAGGATVDAAGQMLDLAVVRRAHLLLDLPP